MQQIIVMKRLKKLFYTNKVDFLATICFSQTNNLFKMSMIIEWEICLKCQPIYMLIYNIFCSGMPLGLQCSVSCYLFPDNTKSGRAFASHTYFHVWFRPKVGQFHFKDFVCMFNNICCFYTYFVLQHVLKTI